MAGQLTGQLERRLKAPGRQTGSGLAVDGQLEQLVEAGAAWDVLLLLGGFWDDVSVIVSNATFISICSIFHSPKQKS